MNTSLTLTSKTSFSPNQPQREFCFSGPGSQLVRIVTNEEGPDGPAADDIAISIGKKMRTDPDKAIACAGQQIREADRKGFPLTCTLQF